MVCKNVAWSWHKAALCTAHQAREKKRLEAIQAGRFLDLSEEDGTSERPNPEGTAKSLAKLAEQEEEIAQKERDARLAPLMDRRVSCYSAPHPTFSYVNLFHAVPFSVSRQWPLILYHNQSAQPCFFPRFRSAPILGQNNKNEFEIFLSFADYTIINVKKGQKHLHHLFVLPVYLYLPQKSPAASNQVHQPAMGYPAMHCI